MIRRGFKPRSQQQLSRLMALATSVALWHCASTLKSLSPPEHPEQLMAALCQAPPKIASVEGEIWLKVQAPELRGQFRVSVLARAPDEVQLDFLNLLGGNEGRLILSPHRLQFLAPADARKNRDQVTDVWAGIPLSWITGLFFGQIPCPERKTSKTSATSAAWEVVSAGPLVLRSPAGAGGLGSGEMTYQVGEFEGAPWAEKLWVREKSAGLASSASLELSFARPEAKSRFPTQWEIRAPQGMLKVRWQQKKITLNP